jgi:hypothetical protein
VADEDRKAEAGNQKSKMVARGTTFPPNRLVANLVVGGSTSEWSVIRLESAQTSLQRFIRVRRSINERLGLGVFESRMRRSVSGLPSRVKDR